MERKIHHLEKGCAAGDQMACQSLQQLMAQEHYKATSGFKSELHRRA